MSIRRTLRLAGPPLVLGTLMLAAPGCGGDEIEPGTQVKHEPVYNADPSSPLSGITLENESANMDKIKAATEGTSK